VVAVDSRNSYLRSDTLPVAALGLDGIAVVVSDDAILVCPLDRSQDLRSLVDVLAGDPRYACLVAERSAGGDS